METESFIIKADIKTEEIRLSFNTKVLAQDALVAVTFTRDELANFIDMLTYCSKQPEGVLVKRDLMNYRKI